LVEFDLDSSRLSNAERPRDRNDNRRCDRASRFPESFQSRIETLQDFIFDSLGLYDHLGRFPGYCQRGDDSLFALKRTVPRLLNAEQPLDRCLRLRLDALKDLNGRDTLHRYRLRGSPEDLIGGRDSTSWETAIT